MQASHPAHPTPTHPAAAHPTPAHPAAAHPAADCGHASAEPGGHAAHHGAHAAGHAPPPGAHGADHGVAAPIHTPAAPTPGTLALQGAGRAALVAAALSGTRNASAAARGEKSTSEAAIDTAVDTAAGAATGAAIGALSGVARGALRGLGFGVLARTAAPVAIGLTAVAVGRDALALSRKSMDQRQFKERVVVHVFRGGTTWIGLEIGAAFGSLVFAGPGTTLGAIAGGMLGYRVGTWLAEERPEDETAGG